MNLLEVKNLDIEYVTEEGTLKAIDNVSFSLKEGESIGLVGESGCGKTTLAKSIMRLLPDNGSISAGEIIFKGEDIVKKSKEEIRKLRLNEIAMISQSAMNALNPVYTVGDQIIEGIRAHSNATKAEAYKRAEEVFKIIGLEGKRLKSYPHQMSGGMKQRAIIAMALTLNPSLIIADEPTTALDVVVQDKILFQIVDIQKKMNSSMVFITHDISVVSEICETIIVMYGGKVMEKVSTKVFFKTPYHPYSLGLQNAFPSIKDIGEELISIPGAPPNLMEKQFGCRFQQRCPFRTELCQNEIPELIEVGEEHLIACHYPERVEEFREKAKKNETWQTVRNRLIEEMKGGE
ncbi:oligopeptide/dipeptide ABC transporter, ATPase subunit [Alkaliphilus metalliredigens QYMF]|uniref:Oligopeptide/dipeptide ABC transporter, ATPase subunit n=1 Tax=Alkaliphilus metalliredigens (strain QYMF) TaxID=293826 RepID=A6TTD8_ALKMQ|nr:ABC transporter ATP-binding protein [Alkaliphilus metalliredigens]ABR49456.1 oligopeptide/dipeptide ABC transporter, ATPase subunit [Alkaliphilus metalliredigens QYMF]